jgi:hypothetical protein
VNRRDRNPALVLVAIAMLVVAGCAAGDPRFTPDDPAGFFTGLWHGAISCVTLLVGIFVDGVGVYETHNTGGWYDFGFLLGVAGTWGGGSHGYRRAGGKRRADAEWQEIEHKVEAKIRRKVREWAEAEPDDDWNVVGEKAEKKLKERVREWADEP